MMMETCKYESFHECLHRRRKIAWWKDLNQIKLFEVFFSIFLSCITQSYYFHITQSAIPTILLSLLDVFIYRSRFKLYSPYSQTQKREFRHSRFHNNSMGLIISS